MIQPLTKHHVIYVDTYYGGMQAFNVALQKNHDIVMTCRQDRPAIFKRGTYTVEENEFGVKSISGTTSKGYSFSANSIPRGGSKRAHQDLEDIDVPDPKKKKVKYTNILSSLHDATGRVCITISKDNI